MRRRPLSYHGWYPFHFDPPVAVIRRDYDLDAEVEALASSFGGELIGT
jgi:hypothetical protein